MNGCGDLCTVAKCEELERKIEELERKIEDHLQKDIPQAHKFEPAWSVDVDVRGDSIFVAVTIDNDSRFDTAELPNPHVESDLKLSASFESETLTISVADGESEDTAQVQIPLPVYEPPEQDNHVESNLKLSASFQSEILTLSVADGESQDTAQVQIPKPEINSEPENNSNLRGSASFRDDTLTISISNGQNTDVFQVNIPTNNSPQTIFITEEVYMNCDELERKIDSCCEEILREISDIKREIISEIDDSENNLTNQIDAAQFVLKRDINDVIQDLETLESYVTIDISGTVDSEYSCNVPTEDSDDPTSDTLPVPAEVSSEAISYNGQGLSGLHEQLKLISNNLLKIYEVSCTEPTIDVDLRDILKSVCGNSLVLDREQFNSESSFHNYSKQLIEQEFKGYLSEKLLKLFKYNSQSGTNFVVSTTNAWATIYSIEKSLKQQSGGIKSVCKQIEELEDRDVVAIVASDKDLHRVKTKVLILQFVLLDVYPKRSNSDSLWQTQIPAAKEEYSWQTDFDLLRRVHGNQYAELQFNEPYVPVSGWFRDVNAANAFFDAILPLTNATEKNRNLPRHSNPEMNIAVFETRPYRAFIKSINQFGSSVCHAKYAPIIEQQ